MAVHFMMTGYIIVDQAIQIQVAQVTKFYIVLPDIRGFSVWNFPFCHPCDTKNFEVAARFF